jgi:hypothetical protein
MTEATCNKRNCEVDDIGDDMGIQINKERGGDEVRRRLRLDDGRAVNEVVYEEGKIYLPSNGIKGWNETEKIRLKVAGCRISRERDDGPGGRTLDEVLTKVQ